MNSTLGDRMQLLEAFENSDNFYSDILSFSKTVESCVLPSNIPPIEQMAHDSLEFKNKIPVESKSATVVEYSYDFPANCSYDFSNEHSYDFPASCSYDFPVNFSYDFASERSCDFPTERSCDLPVTCMSGFPELECSPGGTTESRQNFPVNRWPGFSTKFRPGFSAEFRPNFSTEFRPRFQEGCRPGLPEGCRPGFQEECRSGFQEECRSGFQEECRPDFEEECWPGFKEECWPGFPAICWSDLPTECNPDFPTKSHSDFSEGSRFDLPVEHMSAIDTKYMSGFPGEYSQEPILNNTVEGLKKSTCNLQKGCFTESCDQHLTNSPLKFCSEIPESYRDEAFLEFIDNSCIRSEIPKGFMTNTSLHCVANSSFCSELSREFIDESSMEYESSTSFSSKFSKVYAEEVTEEYMANTHLKFYSAFPNKNAKKQMDTVRSENLSADATETTDMEVNENAPCGLGFSQNKEMLEIVKKEKDILNEAMKEIGLEISFPQDSGINPYLIRKRRSKVKRLRHKNNQTVANDKPQHKKTRVRFGGNGPLNKPRIFPCEVQKGICVAKFKTMHHLNHHVTTHQERDRKHKTTYRCSYYSYDKSEQCSVNVSKKLTLERHYLEHHNMFEENF